MSIVNSTFEGNSGSGIGGGALASMGISRTVINGMFKNNSAIGHDENPARIGPEGGGIGSASTTTATTGVGRVSRNRRALADKIVNALAPISRGPVRRPWSCRR